MVDDFVMVDPPDDQPRPSRLIRQIEEGIYNIKPEDYDEAGDLRVPEADIKEESSFIIVEREN